MVQTLLYKENLYILDDGRVRQFLITDNSSAILIDTGFYDSHVYDIVKGITDAPLTILMTHGDMDHAGGIKDFGGCYMNERDWPLIDADITLHPLKEGDVFECGGYCLETLEIPGHTYGSVAFADINRKILFPGDSVQEKGPIFMFGDHRNLDLYIESQKKLCALAGKIETIIPCHGRYPIGSDYIEKNLSDAIDLKNGKLSGTKHPFMPCMSYQGRWTEFYYNDAGA